MKPTINVRGLEAAVLALHKLGSSATRAVARKAVTVASEPMVAAMSANAPRDEGLLKASMGTRVKQYPDEGLTVAICGVVRGLQGDRARVVHLIEFGHRIAASKTGTLARTDTRKAGVSRVTGERGGGSAGGFVAANPFMRRSYMQTKAICTSIMQQQLVDGVNREAARLRTKVT